MRTLLALIVVFAALPASADIPDPSVVACRSKSPGDECKQHDGASGVCTKTTCSRWRPGGAHTYDCVRCQAKPAEDPKKEPEKKGAVVDDDPTTTRLAGAGIGLLALGLGLFVARRSARRRTTV